MSKRKHKNKISKSVISIIFIIFVIIMIYSGIHIFEWLKENHESKKILDDLKETVYLDEKIESVEKYSIDFQSLKQKNPDTIAWLKVNGTNIEYPVVQTTNNDFYMTHSFDKKKNSAGWVFMDYRNKIDGKDKNTVIYAHNRKDGSLFGTLKNILTEEWQNNEENYKISFITEKEKIEYKVFSVYKIEVEDYYINTEFKTEKEFQNFIDKIKLRSKKIFDGNVTTDDQILTLSTCADNNKYRIVLHAKK